MPVAIVTAAALGVTGYETPAEMETDTALRRRVEAFRLKAGVLMGLGDVATTTVPKVCLVAPPGAGGSLATRMFIPHRVHTSIGVLAAVTVATAAVIEGSAAAQRCTAPIRRRRAAGAPDWVVRRDGRRRHRARMASTLDARRSSAPPGSCSTGPSTPDPTAALEDATDPRHRPRLRGGALHPRAGRHRGVLQRPHGDGGGRPPGRQRLPARLGRLRALHRQGDRARPRPVSGVPGCARAARRRWSGAAKVIEAAGLGQGWSHGRTRLRQGPPLHRPRRPPVRPLLGHPPVHARRRRRDRP